MQGHNFAIIGKAGTGKTLVAKQIMQSLSSAGKKYQLVCSTGVACEVYKGETWPICNALVLNSFFGIGIANNLFANVIEDAVSKCAKKLKDLEGIIWDEFSMNSSRDLELIHCICCKVRCSNLPFGGLQVILVGDWLQLSPVPGNYVTLEGAKMFHTPYIPNSSHISSS